MKAKQKLVRYYRDGWRIGIYQKQGPVWIHILRIKAGGLRVPFKIPVNSKHQILYR